MVYNAWESKKINNMLFILFCGQCALTGTEKPMPLLATIFGGLFFYFFIKGLYKLFGKTNF